MNEKLKHLLWEIHKQETDSDYRQKVIKRVEKEDSRIEKEAQARKNK
jgi:hypothetical protein